MKKEDLKELNELLKHRDTKEEAYEKVPAWKEQYYYELMDYSSYNFLYILFLDSLASMYYMYV